MKKVIIPILSIIFILSSAYIAFDSWSGLASNQTISRAALQNGISTGALARALTVVPSDSERNITASEVNTYIYLDPNNAGYASRLSNQLVIKSDITPLNDSTLWWKNSSSQTSAISACSVGASGTSFQAHFVAPVVVNSYVIDTFTRAGHASYYFFNAVSNTVYKSDEFLRIDSIISCTNYKDTLTFDYVNSTANGYQMRATLAGVLMTNMNVSGLSVVGQTSGCAGSGEASNSSGTTVLSTCCVSFYITATTPLTATSPKYKYSNSVTINGTVHSDGDVVTVSGQAIYIHIITACSTIVATP